MSVNLDGRSRHRLCTATCRIRYTSCLT